MILLLWACAEQPSYRAPVNDINRAPPKLSGTHVVQSGETFYSVAWRYNRDFNELASLNHLTPPYRIIQGQTIQLGAAPSTSKVAPTPAPTLAKSSAGKSAKPVYTQSTSIPSLSSGAIIWQWPSAGKVIGYFSAQNAQKGIDIAGRNGQPVIVAAPGVVVYSGSGLRGYGQMVIIKHNEQFLSAYAHNSRILVKEGDVVKAGGQIAEMGQTDATSVQLHFEIRKNGQPVDPLLYLPKRG